MAIDPRQRSQFPKVLVGNSKPPSTLVEHKWAIFFPPADFVTRVASINTVQLAAAGGYSTDKICPNFWKTGDVTVYHMVAPNTTGGGTISANTQLLKAENGVVLNTGNTIVGTQNDVFTLPGTALQVGWYLSSLTNIDFDDAIKVGVAFNYTSAGTYSGDVHWLGAWVVLNPS